MVPTGGVLSTSVRRSSRQEGKRRRLGMRYWISLLCLLGGCAPTGPEFQAEPLPVIDVHLHALPASYYGDPPRVEFPPGVEWAPTDEELIQGTFAALERNNVVLAVISGRIDRVQRWNGESPIRLLRGTTVVRQACEDYVLEIEPLYQAGELEVFGEVGWQYLGISPSDPSFEPCLAMAERLDIPVGVHMGLGPPGAVSRGSTYRPSMGNPLLFEEALARHPNLRLWVMHAGWPMGEEMIALMHQFPTVYADISLINWFVPRAEFHDYLERLVNAGLAERLMFGSDQGVTPRAIDLGVEAIMTADFLTDEQQRGILFSNAVRFFRLEEILDRQ
jgi:predicted TIM-barrel fold metal-dependent hydrolase